MKRKRRNLANPPRERGLLSASKVSAVRLAKKARPRMAEIAYAQVRRREMLTALDLLKSRNAKTLHVPMLFLERSGNAAAKSL